MKHVIGFKLGPADLIQYVYSVALVTNYIYAWKTLSFYHEASQRVIPWMITPVNSQSIENPNNFYVRYVKVLTRWRIIVQNWSLELKCRTLRPNSNVELHMMCQIQCKWEKSLSFHSVALDSAHAKFDLWTRHNTSYALFNFIAADYFEKRSVLYMSACEVQWRLQYSQKEWPCLVTDATKRSRKSSL